MKRTALKRAAMLRRSRPARVKPGEWTEAAGKKAVGLRSECCEKCGAGGPLDWHHRKNRSQGGTWAPSNGLLLCRFPCHAEVTDTRPEYYAAGWCVEGWREPAEVPFEHWQLGMVRISDDSSTYHLVERPEVIPDDAA